MSKQEGVYYQQIATYSVSQGVEDQHWEAVWSILHTVENDMYQAKMMAKANHPSEEVGVMTPKKMLKQGVILAWEVRLDEIRRQGIVQLDAELSTLRGMTDSLGGQPNKDSLVEVLRLATRVNLTPYYSPLSHIV